MEPSGIRLRLARQARGFCQQQLASLPGYDPARCGELIATLPPPRPPLSPSLEPVP